MFVPPPAEDSGVNGMTTVYTAYECKTSEIQKRPNTLLDALKRGDQCNEVDTPTTVGQVTSETAQKYHPCNT